jgi:hypothetical protein
VRDVHTKGIAPEGEGGGDIGGNNCYMIDTKDFRHNTLQNINHRVTEYTEKSKRKNKNKKEQKIALKNL